MMLTSCEFMRPFSSLWRLGESQVGDSFGVPRNSRTSLFSNTFSTFPTTTMSSSASGHRITFLARMCVAITWALRQRYVGRFCAFFVWRNMWMFVFQIYDTETGSSVVKLWVQEETTRYQKTKAHFSPDDALVLHDGWLLETVLIP